MEAFLADRWLRGCDAEATIDDASVAVARNRVRRESEVAGLPDDAKASIATVVSELAHNQLRHARAGRIAVRHIERAGVAGVEVIAADCGEGLTSVEAIIDRQPHPTSTGLGIGLAGVIALSDEVDFDVRLGEGTCVWARKFAGPVPLARAVAICGRPIDGEDQSGDDATFVRDGTSLVVAVADGLGHGVDASSAARSAIACVVATPAKAPDEILLDAHAAVARSRGAVMAVAALDARSNLQVGVAGNISVRVASRRTDSDHRFMGPSFALGMPGPLPHIRLGHRELGNHEMLVAFSDGLSSRLVVDASLFSVPLIVAARRLLDAYSDGRDDALVLLAR